MLSKLSLQKGIWDTLGSGKKKEFEIYGKKSGGIKLRITGTKFWEHKWEPIMRLGRLIIFFPPYF